MQWGDAYSRLKAVDEAATLDIERLLDLAMSAYLVGRDAESIEILARVHRHAADQGDLTRAIRSAFWAGFQLMGAGDMAQSSGWLQRAQKLLEQSGLDCVERGYLLLPEAVLALMEGRPDLAYPIFEEAGTIGNRFHDRDVITLSGLGMGQALIAQGQTARGIASLDEVMVGVATGEASPVVAGITYCGVIEACHEVFDLRRAQEWTAALSRWLEAQPDLIPFRGQCLVHRSQIMQLHGDWPDALNEARRARERLSEPREHPAVGMAFYQVAELQRLRGKFDEAEDAYRQANQWGHPIQPGLALLRLAQGRVTAAATSIRRALDEDRDPRRRCKVLPAHVEIMLAANDMAAARPAADELSEMAVLFDSAMLTAAAARTRAALLLADDRAIEALGQLRGALSGWQKLDAPYEVARTRVLMGTACRRLGDEDSASMEFDSARRIFTELGAAPDIERMNALLKPAPEARAGDLTGREVEVLALIATGKTNREIAEDLVISERTVARHVSNIFTKLGLSSRAAATAYAYKQGLN